MRDIDASATARDMQNRIHELVATHAQRRSTFDAALKYAENLAVVLHEKHHKATAPNWKPLTGDLIGLLTQIDNMTAGLVKPETNKLGDDVNLLAWYHRQVDAHCCGGCEDGPVCIDARRCELTGDAMGWFE